MKTKKSKKPKIEVIKREMEPSGLPHPAYVMMDELIPAHHDHLVEAKIVLAWNSAWKADDDNRLVLGKCKKVAPLEKELHGFDFVILLNRETWHLSEFTTAMKRALLDHELCHAQVKRDEDGEIKYDDKGRPVWRVRKHDLEEFREIVQRHGQWKSDIQEFVKTAVKASKAPLFQVAGVIAAAGAQMETKAS